jgi:hypothetical protein
MGLLLTVVGFEQFDQGHLDAKVLGILNSPLCNERRLDQRQANLKMLEIPG